MQLTHVPSLLSHLSHLRTYSFETRAKPTLPAPTVLSYLDVFSSFSTTGSSAKGKFLLDGSKTNNSCATRDH